MIEKAEYLGPCFHAEKKEPEECSHPPTSLYSWFAEGVEGKILVVVCFSCNTVLQGGYDD